MALLEKAIWSTKRYRLIAKHFLEGRSRFALPHFARSICPSFRNSLENAATEDGVDAPGSSDRAQDGRPDGVAAAVDASTGSANGFNINPRCCAPAKPACNDNILVQEINRAVVLGQQIADRPPA